MVSNAIGRCGQGLGWKGCDGKGSDSGEISDFGECGQGIELEESESERRKSQASMTYSKLID